MRIHTPPHAGFSLVEVLFAASLLGILVMVFVGSIISGRETMMLAGERGRAELLATEGLEASRNIRDQDYTNLCPGTYGLAQSGNTWVYSGTSDTSGIYTRRVLLETVDSERTRATSTVTWQQRPGNTGTVQLVSYLTNWVARIGNWAVPVQTSVLNMAGTDDAVKIQVRGNYAYLVRSAGTPNFFVINITNPAAPSIAGSATLSAALTNIAIGCDYAYVTSTSNTAEVMVVDITNPAAPALTGTYNAPNNADANGVFAVGTTIYAVRATSADNEFMIINAATPATPTLVGSLNLNDTGYEVTVLGNNAYVASANNAQEVQSISIATPATPTLAGSLNLGGNTDVLTIAGFGTTLVTGRSNGDMNTVSVAVPAVPALQGTYAVGTQINDVSIGQTNTRAFLGTNNATEFRAVNITNPAAPALFGSLSTAANLLGVAYHQGKDIVFAASNDNAGEMVVISPT